MKKQMMFLLKYNRDDNNQVMRLLEKLSDEERKADRGAYFKSLHGLYEHVATTGLFFQRMLIAAFPGLDGLASSYIDFKLERGKINFENFSDLVKASLDISDSYIRIVDELSEDDLNKAITVNTPQNIMEMEVWLILYRYINHSTHHKGQIMQILEEMGVDCDFGGIKPTYD